MTTILITGASRGIGLEFVKQYSKEDASIIACCRNPDSANVLNAIAKESGGKVRVQPLDVANKDSIAALAVALDGQPIDIVINNAGISGPRKQSAGEIDPEGWLDTFRVNTVAPVLVAQALRKNVKLGHDKKIVVITSMMGSTEDHGGGMYAYRSSKAALNNAMRGLAREWAKDGIVVGILHPGWVRTDMGGKNAAVAVEDSVKGLRQRIADLRPENSGRYVDYAGAELRW
jgi:NAD(P)-dependent dehydrogenase (short-subunit alcohol dehydrogenase family)